MTPRQRSNRRSNAPDQILIPVTILHTTLVTIKGSPRTEDLLNDAEFRRIVEHQFAVETGIQTGSLDWTNVALGPPSTSGTTRVGDPLQPSITVPFKILQPIEGSSTTPDPTSTEPDVARKPTKAEMMAMITTLDSRITALDTKVSDQNTMIDELEDKMSDSNEYIFLN
ncbi:hypothetical protein P3T76_005791 [Phytophthora citrophthora]|uniref:Uncharacterized protein n=1 Tax=Phytophthora citrophthora TaxID=4793 RepID=A0AAD9GQH0_9STRA|nr:hypothetical protein P3T76_005791 [Phytophthora citrophthora]